MGAVFCWLADGGTLSGEGITEAWSDLEAILGSGVPVHTHPHPPTPAHTQHLRLPFALASSACIQMFILRQSTCCLAYLARCCLLCLRELLDHWDPSMVGAGTWLEDAEVWRRPLARIFLVQTSLT